MIYAQTNYPGYPIGIPPTRYTISQVGCFITSFCNLLSERFGRDVDPPSLNAYLRDNNLYTDVDDGVRDDVGWNTVTSFDSDIRVEAIGSGTPPHNNSIVKFVYNGGANTHFCLVNDVNSGTIIDSWDGKIRSWDFYGGVNQWASYINKGEEIPMVDKDAVTYLWKGFLDRTPTEDEYSNFVGKPYPDVLFTVYNSQEYKDRYAALLKYYQAFANQGKVTKSQVVDYINKNLN